ncbi:MAG: hypothetical protein ACI9N1_000868 [Flavobacteriales bacterium]|jgi:hypothetical protein
MGKLASFSKGKIRITKDTIEVNIDPKLAPSEKSFKVDRDIITEIYQIRQSKTANMKGYHQWLSGIAIIILFIIGSYILVQTIDSKIFHRSPIISEISFWFTLIYFIGGLFCIAIMITFELNNNMHFIATRFYYLLRSKNSLYVCIKSQRKERLILVRNKKEANKMVDFLTVN